jgi:hypothetical protein
VADITDILKILLEKGQTTKAGRLAGAFRNIGRLKESEEIVRTMKSVGYDVRIEDMFVDDHQLSYSRTVSPYTTRLALM